MRMAAATEARTTTTAPEETAEGVVAAAAGAGFGAVMPSASQAIEARARRAPPAPEREAKALERKVASPATTRRPPFSLRCTATATGPAGPERPAGSRAKAVAEAQARGVTWKGSLGP